MAASGRTDDSEILFSHIDMLTSKLEILHTSTAPGTVVANHVASAGGKAWQKQTDSF